MITWIEKYPIPRNIRHYIRIKYKDLWYTSIGNISQCTAKDIQMHMLLLQHHGNCAKSSQNIDKEIERIEH